MWKTNITMGNILSRNKQVAKFVTKTSIYSDRNNGAFILIYKMPASNDIRESYEGM